MKKKQRELDAVRVKRIKSIRMQKSRKQANHNDRGVKMETEVTQPEEEDDMNMDDVLADEQLGRDLGK